MTESNTRRWWRSRLKGFAMNITGKSQFDEWDCDRHVLEGWLSDLMDTPELSLSEWAEQNGGKLGVFVSATTPVQGTHSCGAVSPDWERGFAIGFENAINAMVDDGWRKVVRMEGK